MPEDPTQPSPIREEPPRKVPLYRRILFLSIPYLLIVLLLLGIEGGVRYFLPYLPVLEVFVQRPALRPDLAENIDSSVFMGDPWLIWRLRPNVKNAIWEFTVVSTNGQGFRHPGDIGRKRKGAIRILCLGDSVTFGFRVPLVFPEYPDAYAREFICYPLLVEKRLRDANPGKLIEVIPMAVPAYTSYQGLNWLERDISRLKPDVVTTCFGWNDVSYRVASDHDAMPLDWQHLGARWLLAHSQALTHFSRWRHTKNVKGAPPPPPANTLRVSIGDYLVNQVKMAWIARNHGARPMFIGSIYRDAVEDPREAALMKQYRDLLRASAAELDIPFLDVIPLSEEAFPANVPLFGERIHPNGWGHQVFASELLKFFKEHKMLPTLEVPESL